MFDYHLHSTFSPDSNQSLEEICKAAIDIGLAEIAITDHVDKDHPEGMSWDFEYSKYSDKLDEIRKAFEGKLIIRKGVEIGVQTHIIDMLNNYVEEHKFDFIIASVHCAEKCDIGFTEFHTGRTQREVYLAYLKNLLYIVQNFTNYNVVGHFDLIARYGNYDNKVMPYKEYSDIIDEILTSIINANRGIEVNTSGYRYGLGATHPRMDILKRYKELGGEILTVGSDAHKVADVGYRIKETYEMVKTLGFNYVATYKGMKPEFNKI